LTDKMRMITSPGFRLHMISKFQVVRKLKRNLDSAS